MRADRLLSLMLALQAEGRLTANALAARFEVSERTIYRDIDALSAAGVPIYTQTGTNGGIFLDEKYRTSLTGFSATELRVLFVAGDAGPLRDLGLAGAALATNQKLLAALPASQRQEVHRLRQRFYIDSTRWFDYDETPSVLPDLQRAIWEDRQILLSYRNYEGTLRERTLEPHALIAKANAWYLIARAPGEPHRTYRAARIVALTLTDTHFIRDASFDPEEYWRTATRTFTEQREAEFPFYPALLRLTTAAFDLIRAQVPARHEELAPPDSSGWRTIRALFLSPHEARSNVLGLGTQVCVIEPDELRLTVLATARAIVAQAETSNE